MLNCFTDLLTNTVISTNSCAVGLMLMVVSAKKTGPFLVNIIYIPATRLTPASVPIICKAGFTVVA